MNLNNLTAPEFFWLLFLPLSPVDPIARREPSWLKETAVPNSSSFFGVKSVWLFVSKSFAITAHLLVFAQLLLELKFW